MVEFTINRFPGLNVNHGDIFDNFFDDFKYTREDKHSGYDHIICNPPFKKIIKHIDRVYSFLKLGASAICLVPTTYKKIEHQVLDILPNDSFLNCKVSTMIIKITKWPGSKNE